MCTNVQMIVHLTFLPPCTVKSPATGFPDMNQGKQYFYRLRTEEKMVLMFIRVVVKHSIFRQIKLSIVVNAEGGFEYSTHVP